MTRSTPSGTTTNAAWSHSRRAFPTPTPAAAAGHGRAHLRARRKGPGASVRVPTTMWSWAVRPLGGRVPGAPWRCRLVEVGVDSAHVSHELSAGHDERRRQYLVGRRIPPGAAGLRSFLYASLAAELYRFGARDGRRRPASSSGARATRRTTKAASVVTPRTARPTGSTSASSSLKLRDAARSGSARLLLHASSRTGAR